MSINLDDITNKIVLEKLRLRCNICYSEYSDDAYVSIVNKLFTYKVFFIYNKKNKKTPLYQDHALICSMNSLKGNNSNSTDTARIKYGKTSSFGSGNIIQIELCCDKCYNTRFCEVNLEKLSGQNHWL